MYAVITGATQGIGRAITELLVDQGFNVAICARTESTLQAFAETLRQRKKGVKVLAKATDMSKPEQVNAFSAYIRTHWTQIHILVNNAGVFLPGTLTDPEGENAFLQMMDTNLRSAYFMTQGALPLMRPHQEGHIFTVCSIASIMPYGMYSVSKYALLGYSKVLREELKSEGIRVTALLPGATRTASWEGTDLPDSRFMKAEDIAKALWSCYQLSEQTVVEEMILRPQLGDI